MERNTLQKDIILKTVNGLTNHPTADMIYSEIIKLHPTISKATVYRNLNLLAKNGEISKVKMLDGPDCFDYKKIPHYHAKCDKCGKIIDIDMQYMINLDNIAQSCDGFSYQGHTLIFNGLCSDCK